jgi:DNA (cytosine-5)-methyltransferase 1
MENVPHLLKFDGGRIFNDFVRRLERNGYNVWYSLIDCQSYGVPQTRKRLVLLASRLGAINLIGMTHSPSRYRTVRQAIGKLPRISDGQACADDPLHLASKLSSKNKLRIRQSRPGGTWRDWEPELIVECHRKKTGKTYPGVYGRMKWDEPGPTITTQCHGIGNGRFGHPRQSRAISLREAALLQTFPRSYVFVEPEADVVISNVARHIGNAVPVRLGRIIARSIKRHLESHHGSNAQV